MPYFAILTVVEAPDETEAWESLTGDNPNDCPKVFAGNPWTVAPASHDGGLPVFDTDDALNQRRP